MERKHSDGVWIEVNTGFLPESIPINRELNPPEVEIGMTVCSDMGRPIVIERVGLEVAGNSAYTGKVVLGDGIEWPGHQVLGPCGTIEIGPVKLRAVVHHLPGGSVGESTVPFGMYAWVDWRSDGHCYVSRQVMLQAYEPTGFAVSEEGFSLTVAD